MARASYIYLAENYNGNVVAAFTVKHEALSWVEKFIEDTGLTLSLSRVPDSGSLRSTVPSPVVFFNPPRTYLDPHTGKELKE